MHGSIVILFFSTHEFRYTIIPAYLAKQDSRINQGKYNMNVLCFYAKVLTISIQNALKT